MKKICSVLCLLTSFFIFSGCPYDSEVPIDAPSLSINTALLGTWEARNNQDESFKISKHDEFSFNIVKTSKKSNEKKEAEKYRAHLSTINNVTFLNLSDDNPDVLTPKYYLYKLVITNPGIVTLSEITENIDERFKTSDELKKFIAANMKNSYFYSKDEASYIRTDKK